jgi:hypothetical protein
MEIMSSSMGGYLAGRLRTKWTIIHSDEVYFRDTAHGFLAWCVALVVSAAFLASAATSMVGSSFSRASHSDTNAAQAVGTHDDGPNAYFVDSLFRTTGPRPEGGTAATAHQEAATVLAHALEQRNLALADKIFLARLVSETTGLSQADSNQRVDDVFGDATHAAETARKSIAHTLLWTFLALLIGAFCASFSATIGGKQRDHVVII